MSARSRSTKRQRSVGFVFNKRSHIYVYFDTVFGNNLNRKLWDEIEKVTTKDRPFYENEYYVLTVNRVPDSYWKLSKTYDNVHIISPKMLFSAFNENYKKIKRPRFVPSFVCFNYFSLQNVVF